MDPSSTTATTPLPSRAPEPGPQAPTPAEALVPRMAARAGRRGTYEAQLAHLAPGFDVRDVLATVGPCPNLHERPVLTISLCDLPHDRQRAAFAELASWPHARVNLRGVRGDRATIRWDDRPQLVVSFSIEAVCTQVEAEPERRFTWAVRSELLR